MHEVRDVTAVLPQGTGLAPGICMLGLNQCLRWDPGPQLACKRHVMAQAQSSDPCLARPEGHLLPSITAASPER